MAQLLAFHRYEHLRFRDLSDDELSSEDHGDARRPRVHRRRMRAKSRFYTATARTRLAQCALLVTSSSTSELAGSRPTTVRDGRCVKRSHNPPVDGRRFTSLPAHA